MALDLPLVSIHKQAFKAAEVAHCAEAQDQFWEMHDRLFTKVTRLGSETFSSLAQELGLDMSRFESCLKEEKFAPEVKKSLAVARRAGVTSTPTFLLGYTIPKRDEIQVVMSIRGAQSFSNFKRAMDSLLKKDGRQ